MKSKRQQAIEAAHERAKKEQEEKAKAKREQERYALQQQMKVSCYYNKANYVSVYGYKKRERY